MAETPTGFYHNVYFWAADASAAAKIAEGCAKHLAGIPGVLRLNLGKPAGTDRAVVDNSYGVALLVEFADRAAHDVYQDHADHHAFIDECKAYWTKVQVYDSLPFG
ncbi:MAG TPA: Dabb family protein [Capsulimonadaceae bacterium]